jgi:hypothetical protein
MGCFESKKSIKNSFVGEDVKKVKGNKQAAAFWIVYIGKS